MCFGFISNLSKCPNHKLKNLSYKHIFDFEN